MRPKEIVLLSQQAGHILAHSILGAAVSYATGNDAVTGGISAGSGEATAPLLSQFLYGTKDSSKLNAEQKDTISAITSALGVGIGATTGGASNAANAAETSKVAVEDNGLQDIEMMFPNENFRDPNFSRKELEAIKRLPSEIASVHNYYNDMTIVSFSAGMVSYTVIINNKNGNTWVTGVEKKDKNGQPYYSAIPEIGINLKLNELAKAVSTSNGKVSRPVGVSASVNFGSIVGGQKKAAEIDSVIEGSSVGIQACHGACIGGVYTRAKDKVVTYGIGSSQIGMSGGNMVKVSGEKRRKILNALGITK